MKLRIAIALLVLTSCSCSPAQTPTMSPNSDIVKMLGAGLPEDVILDKIHQGAGRWDTSVDALIVLKKAGATVAELRAMTTPGTTQSVNATAAAQPVELFGGLVQRNRAGVPTVSFTATMPGVFPNGLPNNTAYLLMYGDKPAVLIPSTMVVGTTCVAGNLLVTAEDVKFDPYTEGCGILKSSSPIKIDTFTDRHAEPVPYPWHYAFSEFFEADLKNADPFGEGLRLKRKLFHGEREVFDVGIFPFLDNYLLFGGHTDVRPMRSVAMANFFTDLLHNFDGTVSQFARAAGYANAMEGFGPNARYQTLTQDSRDRYGMALHQRLMERANQGNGWLQLAQGVEQTRQFTAGMMGAAVGASQNNAAQFSAGINVMASASGNSTLNAMNSGTGGGDLSANPAVSAADTAGIAGSYSGANAEWVHRLMGLAQNWSCNPIRMPSYDKSACLRDQKVTQAEMLAVAAECNARIGKNDNAQKEAEIMLQTLKDAHDLCGNGIQINGTAQSTGGLVCSGSVLSCEQLPQ